MPIVSQNLWEEGDVPKAAELNGLTMIQPLHQLQLMH
jgi:hypothetical protein